MKIGDIEFRHLDVFQKDADELAAFLSQTLVGYGYHVEPGAEFLYAPGSIPVMLVAHVDTVFSFPPKDIFYDSAKTVLWSPQGLGADDRAGVAAILEILLRGFRPHILFTDGEESGCTGAMEAITALPKMSVKDVGYIIELDRRGSNEAVFYGCGSRKFMNYVLEFGFKKEQGIYTDICILCPSWGIAGANLSTGSYDSHTKTEILNLSEWLVTVNKVARMLRRNRKEQFPITVNSNAGRGMFGLAGLKYGQVYSYPDGKLDSLDWEKDSMRPTRSEIELMSAFDDLDGWGEELGVTISAAELSDFFGGSVSLWSNWLRENAAELKKDWDTLIFDDIDDRVIEMGAPFNKGTQQGG
jgi:hypothetical protein